MHDPLGGNLSRPDLAGPPGIDVVICTYNNAASLDDVLAALGAQEGVDQVDWGVLVVDNNSTDGTAEVVDRHKRNRGLPISLVREFEQGLTPARRRGVRETRRDWIAFVDDDCVVASDWIARAADFARERPDAGAFGGQVLLSWVSRPPEHVASRPWAYAEQRHGEVMITVSCLVGAGMIVRRRALAAVGWIDEPMLADRVGRRLVSGGDVEIALRIGGRYSLWYDPRLRLRHVIPPRRTTPHYFTRLVYGLGTSKLLGDSLLWAGTYRRWLAISVRDCWPLARSVLGAVRRGRRADAVVSAAFLGGWVSGIWHLLRMSSARRRNLVGCAGVAEPD